MVMYWKILGFVFILAVAVSLVNCGADPPLLIVKNLSSATTVDVYIDNIYTMQVPPGETKDIEVSEGVHTVLACPAGITPPHSSCLDHTRAYSENLSLQLRLSFRRKSLLVRAFRI